MTIRAKLYSLIGIFFLALCAVWLVAMRGMNQVKIGGEQYTALSSTKDLVADILPPPVYVVEPYLVVLQAANEADPEARRKDLEHLRKLRATYDERFTFWSKQLSGREEGQRAILARANDDAGKFFAIIDRDFAPALAAGDLPKAQQIAYGPLKARYEGHRSSIDELVGVATARSERAEREAQSVVSFASVTTIVAALLALAVCSVLGWFLSRDIGLRLDATVKSMRLVAAGDLTARVQVRGSDELADAGTCFNDLAQQMDDGMGRIRQVAGDVAAAASELSSAADQISNGAQAQAAQLEETAANIEEITSTVRQNAGNAQQASQLSEGSREVAETGGRVVGSAISAMGDINAASDRIANIIATINEIAFQTNLLALNAAVEAARAGDQGRGFAVVATEVRNLAQRSAAAAREIKALIQDSVQKVDRGAELVTNSGETLQDIVASVKRVTDIVSEIAAASREQATGVEQVNSAMSQMGAITQANAAQTEELSATASSMADLGRTLSELVGRFRVTAEGRPAVAAPSRPRAVAPAHRASGVMRSERPAAPRMSKAAGARGGYEEF
jgi:methyl-accepting chemotaxis protein